MTIQISVLSGTAILPQLDALAALRIQVFRDFPYLYEGSLGYEQQYLRHYASSANSVFVLALDGEQVVGASTGIPLLEADSAFAAPFAAQGIAPEQVFYFGESVLLAAYRGQGLGHAFFDHREAFARQLGLPITAFCAVIRPDDHPLKPADYRPLDGFWQARGYRKQPGLISSFHWRDVGAAGETEKSMQFWMRRSSNPPTG